MDARTEEIRARVAFYPPGSNCNYCYGSEHYAEDVPYLLTELTALREEVERLKGALRAIASKPCGCLSSSNPNWHHETCWKFFALAALSPSPAQQETVPKQD